MNKPSWTKEQDQQLLAARDRGDTFNQIATATKRGRESVRKRYRMLSAGEVGVGESLRPQEFWQRNEAELIKRIQAGQSYAFIGRAFNRTGNAVAHRASALRRLGRLPQLPVACNPNPAASHNTDAEGCAIHAEAVMAEGGFAWLSERSLGNGRYAACLPLNYPSKEV